MQYKFINRFFSKIVSAFTVGVFFISNITGLAAMNIDFKDTLSPSIQITNGLLKDQFGLTQNINKSLIGSDLSALLYSRFDNNTLSEVMVTQNGYRIKIKSSVKQPLLLYWGVNGWQEPNSEIISNIPEAITHFDERGQVKRTGRLSDLSDNNIFTIDIPEYLIAEINSLDFLLYDPLKDQYIRTSEGKDFFVPVNTAIELALSEGDKESEKKPEKISDIAGLLKKRLGIYNTNLGAESTPLYYEKHSNIINQLVRTAEGYRVDFWVISNYPPILHWGIDGWQTPLVKIRPKKTVLVKNSKAVSTEMDRVSASGLYQTSIYLSESDFKQIEFLDYNIYYPNNGHWDNNEEKDYKLSFSVKTMTDNLLTIINDLSNPLKKRIEASQLLRNIIFLESENLNFSQLLSLFKDRDNIQADHPQDDILGFILVAKLLNEGAKWSDQNNALVIDKDKVTENIKQLIDKLDNMTVHKSLYLFGMLKTSFISRLVHSLDYNQIYIDVENGKIKDLKKHLQDMILEYDDYDDPANVPVVIEADSIDNEKLFLTLEFANRKISFIIGYPTKEDNFFYKGNPVLIREKWGNEFSPVGLDLAAHVDSLAVKQQIKAGQEKGIKFAVDWIPWLSPEVLNQDNYVYFHHKVIEGDINKVDLLLEQNNYTTLLELAGGKKILVYHRWFSADQLKPDLTPDGVSGRYWKDYYINYLKYFIDEFNVDAFRVDLPGELQEYDDYSVFKSVCFYMVNYAASKQKKIYFPLEAYGEKQWAEFSSWNRDPEIAKLGYEPFRCYYKLVAEAVEKADPIALSSALQWVVKRTQNLIISFSNFDEKHAADILPDEKLHENYLKLLNSFVRGGFDALVYLRDLGLGDIIPVVGGDRASWGGGARYYTHKFATKKQFRDRLDKPVKKLLEESGLYNAVESEPNTSFSQVFFRDGKVVFYRPGFAPEIFDLEQMKTSIQPISLLDIENNAKLWCEEHILMHNDFEQTNPEMFKLIQNIITGENNKLGVENELFEQAFSGENKNFAQWDWFMNSEGKFIMQAGQVLALANDNPFVIELKVKGAENDVARRVPCYYSKSYNKYLALIFGMDEADYEINFLWPYEYKNSGYGDKAYELEVLSQKEFSKKLEESKSRAPFLSDQAEEFFANKGLEHPEIKTINKNKRNKLFFYQVPVFSCRQKQGQEKGIGKWTDYARTFKQYNRATGANAILSLPIHPTLDKAHSSYSSVSNYALNELFNDWDHIIDQFFPDLMSAKPGYFQSVGTVNYDQVEKRERDISWLVFHRFKLLSDKDVLVRDFQKFKKEYSWWLDDYCSFRALGEMFEGKSWWEWKGIEAAKNNSHYDDIVNYYAFMQFIALKQWKQAVSDIHDLGGKIIYDRPYFCSKNSVEVWASYSANNNYFHGIEKSPGLDVPGRELSIWGSLAEYNYTNLKNMPNRAYDLILKDHEYKLDVLNFDGGRIDAGHMAYGWTKDYLKSGDEPGDELLLAIMSVFEKRSIDLFIVEQLGAEGYVMDKIRDLGVYTMEELKWNPNPQGKVMVSLNSHDQPRIGVHYGDDTEQGYLRQLSYVFQSDAPLVYITAGEEIGDNHRINNPQLESEADRIKFNWRYRIPHPSDIDYGKRVRFDLTAKIRRLAFAYMGDWKKIFYNGLFAGRAVVMDDQYSEILDIINKNVEFTLRYDYGTKDLQYIKLSAKAIFNQIFVALLDETKGVDSLIHHGQNDDFFVLVESVLSSNSESKQSKVMWQQIRDLRENNNQDVPIFIKQALNIELLGFMTGLFEKLEEKELLKTAEFKLNKLELFVEHSI